MTTIVQVLFQGRSFDVYKHVADRIGLTPGQVIADSEQLRQIISQNTDHYALLVLIERRNLN